MTIITKLDQCCQVHGDILLGFLSSFRSWAQLHADSSDYVLLPCSLGEGGRGGVFSNVSYRHFRNACTASIRADVCFVLYGH